MLSILHKIVIFRYESSIVGTTKKLVVGISVIILISILLGKLYQINCANNHSDPIRFQDTHVYEASFNEIYYNFKGSIDTQYEIKITSVHLNDGINEILADNEFPLEFETGIQNFSLHFSIIGNGQDGNHSMYYVYIVDCGYVQTATDVVYFNSTA